MKDAEPGNPAARLSLGDVKAIVPSKGKVATVHSAARRFDHSRA
jgi:hypothetical protein